MNGITSQTILLITMIKIIVGYHQRIIDVVKGINYENNIEINVIINLFKTQQDDQLNELLQNNDLPTLFITQPMGKIDPLYVRSSSQSLTIAWINWTNLNDTIELMDRLLWTIHLTDILFVYNTEGRFEEQQGIWSAQNDLYEIASLCWNKGFVSVLIWLNQQLYTYHPYPSIKIKQIISTAEFRDKTYLKNFHRHIMTIAFMEYPPPCFTYTNRKGQVLRVGYTYTWIKLFLQYHNASIRHKYYNIWSRNASYETAIKLTNRNIFLPIIFQTTKHYQHSYCLLLYKSVLLVPAPKEIDAGLYSMITFDSLVWFTILLCGIFYFGLMNFIWYLKSKQLKWGQSFQDALKIIIFVAVNVKTKYYFSNFVLHLLFLFTGIFITNYYSSSLFSLYTNKIYEPNLVYIEDISRNNLKIFQHSAEVAVWEARNMSTIVSRFLTNLNHLYYRNRNDLNMEYMYISAEHLADYLLFRQRYLKRPIAMKLSEPLNYNPLVIAMPYRSPILNQFNRYLLHLRESGIFDKILVDTQWHGYWSGNFKLLVDDDRDVPLSFEYFHYIFLIWLIGLISAIVCFMFEIFLYKKSNKN